ncbi:toxin-antitoxin system HicB family antitoxin [Streptomyces carpaticus]|uniref:Toxin-antitoxin system HicB family antitoxin n=1 Tax=Streptomyces carpaticus TaxID=285558 RepID=A0ABV4ZJ09_9ACTN
MDLTPYVDQLRSELSTAAEAGGEESRALAERLSATLESAGRLTLLEALSAAMGEVTRDLAPGSVDVRLRGLDPEFVVIPPPAIVPEAPYLTPPGHSAGAAGRTAPPPPPPPPAADGAEEGGTARINLRLPAHLKARAEEAAAQEGLSVNAWLVRAVSAALDQGPGAGPAPVRGRGSGPQRLTGWVR